MVKSLGFSRKWACARFFYCLEFVSVKVMESLKGSHLKGIQFVVDEVGKKNAVLIDLEEWGEVWEGIYDILVAKSYKNETLVDWQEVKAEMKKEATDTLIASESSLKKDWLRPEEDEAWQNLRLLKTD